MYADETKRNTRDDPSRSGRICSPWKKSLAIGSYEGQVQGQVVDVTGESQRDIYLSAVWCNPVFVSLTARPGAAPSSY